MAGNHSMRKFEFQLVYQVPVPEGIEDSVSWADDYVEALLGSGCDDALVGSGRQGILVLDFSRQARTEAEAMQSALMDVAQAIPNANLVS